MAKSSWQRGYDESIKDRSCDTSTCACTLTYWEKRIPAADRSDFYDGWTFAATGDPEYAEKYSVH